MGEFARRVNGEASRIHDLRFAIERVVGASGVAGAVLRRQAVVVGVIAEGDARIDRVEPVYDPPGPGGARSAALPPAEALSSRTSRAAKDRAASARPARFVATGSRGRQTCYDAPVLAPMHIRRRCTAGATSAVLLLAARR